MGMWVGDIGFQCGLEGFHDVCHDAAFMRSEGSSLDKIEIQNKKGKVKKQKMGCISL